MEKELIHSCPELIDYINEIGFLPLLPMGITGWSADEIVDEDCQYNRLPDGGWEWPLWEWKGSGMAALGVERFYFAGKRLRIRQIFQKQGCIYQS